MGSIIALPATLPSRSDVNTQSLGLPPVVPALSAKGWASADIVVIGAGIIGSALSYFLAKRGQRVAVFERAGGMGGATAATHSNLSLHNRVPGPTFAIAMETYRALDQLSLELDHDFGFARLGGLLLVEDPSLMPELRERVRRQQQAGLEIEVVDENDLYHLDSSLVPGLAGAAYCPLSATVYSVGLCFAFQQAAQRLGTRFYHHTPVTGIDVVGDRIAGVRSGERRLSTASIVNAAGAGADAVAAMAGLRLVIVPDRGHVVITERTPSFGVGMKSEFVPSAGATGMRDPSRDRWSTRFVLSRTAQGHAMIGRSGEQGMTAREVKLGAVSAILNRAAHFVPSVRSMRVLRIMTGLRPYSGDKLPVLGPAGSVEGFFFAAGFGDSGIGHFMSTRYLADGISSGQLPRILDPLRYSRPGLQALAS